MPLRDIHALCCRSDRRNTFFFFFKEADLCEGGASEAHSSWISPSLCFLTRVKLNSWNYNSLNEFWEAGQGFPPCSPAAAQKIPGTRRPWWMPPSLLIHIKLVIGNTWQMGCEKEPLMHSVSALCLPQQKQFCRLSSVDASLHLGRCSSFYYGYIIGSLHRFNKWTGFAYFEVFKRNS